MREGGFYCQKVIASIEGASLSHEMNEAKGEEESQQVRERGREGEERGFSRDGFHKTNAVQPKVKFANSSYCRLLSFANETTLGWGYGDNNNDLRAHTHKIKEYAELPVRHKNDHFRTKSNYCPARRRVL